MTTNTSDAAGLKVNLILIGIPLEGCLFLFSKTTLRNSYSSLEGIRPVDILEKSGAVRWYANHTKPEQEGRADSNLRAWRVESFTPRENELGYTPAGHVKNQLKPLFPQYIFARFDARRMLRLVYFTRGVHDVVRFR